jgi:type III pantothenate kinase
LNLIVEQGNSATKIAVFSEGEMVFSSVYKDFNESDWIYLLNLYPLKNGILSTVTEAKKELIACLNDRLQRFFFFDERVLLPIDIRCQRPETLGTDRIAAAVGARFLKPATDLLVIDTGTAVTYELVTAQGIYSGGNISPGLTTRFRALNLFTRRLPLVNEQEAIPLLGTSTETAILAGVVHGMVFEMDGFIDALRKQYPDIFVFLTGGHSVYFEKRLKNTIFAVVNLVLIGLNRILEYNVENQ